MKLKNIVQGMGSIFDLYPRERESTKLTIPTLSDAEALKNDWEVVGKDLLIAAGMQKNESSKK